jgi:hypothetical protein
MGGRVAALGLVGALLLATGGCSDDEEVSELPGLLPDESCVEALPDGVFTTLGWTAPPKPAEGTVRGCHRETEQGYVEVRPRPAYDGLCDTLDRTGTPAPGQPVDWLGNRTACAVEPPGGVGQTKVAVKQGSRALLVTVVALTATDQAKVRAAVAQVLAASATL